MLVDDLEENQQEAEMRAQELSEELLQEIHELQARGIELKQLEQDQSPIHLLQVRYLKGIQLFCAASAFF